MAEQRLIDANAFDNRVRVAGGFAEEELSDDFKDGVLAVLEMLKRQPTIEERKTGKWIEVEVFPDSYDIYGNKTWSSEMQCDQCGFRHTAIEGHMAQYNFCPNCGADMRGEGGTDEKTKM